MMFYAMGKALNSLSILLVLHLTTYSYSDGTTTYGPFNTSSNPEIIPVTPTTTSNYTLITYADDKCPGTMAGTAQVTVNPLPVATGIGNSIHM
jgi:hypothetical protein